MSTSLSSAATQVPAVYFDGRTAAGVAVTLTTDGQDLFLRWADNELRWPLHDVQISERLGNTPRLISLADGGHCEVTDHARFELLLNMLGVHKGWLDKLQHSLGWAAGALLFMAVMFAAGYRYLLPWAAEALSPRVPDIALKQMSDSTLDFLSHDILKPSRLSAERQQELTQSFARLVSNAEGIPPYHILFRHSPAMGANAFALPDGTIVVLDDLVDLSHDDNEIIAVLGHELGHVQRRHGVRLLLQSSIVGLVLTWYLGDFSTLLVGAPTLLLQAKYSRDMEREADEYSAQLLQGNGLSSCLLAGMLGKLEASHQKKEAAQNQHEGEATNVVADYLSSHPATRERMQSLCRQPG